jgi:hypothetical protein
VLKDLIIDAIYADILRGKLDQKQQQFEVRYTMGQDLRPGQLEELLEALQDWSAFYDGFGLGIDCLVSSRSSRIPLALDALDGKIGDRFERRSIQGDSCGPRSYSPSHSH